MNKGEFVRIFVTGVANMFIVHIHLQRESRVAGWGGWGGRIGSYGGVGGSVSRLARVIYKVRGGGVRCTAVPYTVLLNPQL